MPSTLNFFIFFSVILTLIASGPWIWRADGGMPRKQHRVVSYPRLLDSSNLVCMLQRSESNVQQGERCKGKDKQA